MRKSGFSVFLCAATLLPLLQRGTARAEARDTASQATACVFDHQMLWSPPGTCRPEAKRYPGDVSGAVQRAIYDSALTFDLPYDALLGVAKCESNLNPKARNGMYRGLFQFETATFKRAVSRMRRETGIVARSVWNARDSSYAAAYLFVTDQGGSWTCARGTG